MNPIQQRRLEIEKSIRSTIGAGSHSNRALENAMDNILEKGGRKAFIGEIREFAGSKYQKEATGWKYIGDKEHPKFFNIRKQRTKTQDELENPEAIETVADALDQIENHFKGDKLVQEALDFMRPLLQSNPKVKFKEDYQFPVGVYGLSFPDGGVAINWNAFGSKDMMYRTVLHEFVHVVTRDEIKHNAAFRADISSILGRVRSHLGLPDSYALDQVIPVLVANGIVDENKYGIANEDELIAEVFTNQKFNDFLKSIPVEKKSNLLQRVFQSIAKLFSKKYQIVDKAKHEAKENNVADYLLKLTESVIKYETESKIEKSVNYRELSIAYLKLIS